MATDKNNTLSRMKNRDKNSISRQSGQPKPGTLSRGQSKKTLAPTSPRDRKTSTITKKPPAAATNSKGPNQQQAVPPAQAPAADLFVERAEAPQIILYIVVGIKEEIQFPVQTTELVSDVVSKLALQFGFANDGRLGLIDAERKNEFLDPRAMIGDAIYQINWLRLATRIRVGKRITNGKDLKWLEEFDFFEARNEILVGDCDKTYENAVYLTALGLQIYLPDSKQDLSYVLNDEILQDYTPLQWRKMPSLASDIAHAYPKFRGMDKETALNTYLDAVYKIPNYGEAYFRVKTKSQQIELLAIGISRVARLNLNDTCVIEEWKYPQIRSWDPSPDLPYSPESTSTLLTLKTDTGDYVWATAEPCNAGFLALLIRDHAIWLAQAQKPNGKQAQSSANPEGGEEDPCLIM